MSPSALRKIEAVVEYGRARRIASATMALACWLSERGRGARRMKTKHRRSA